MEKITLTDAKGEVQEITNKLHIYGVSHPFTLALITFLVGLLLGMWIT